MILHLGDDVAVHSGDIIAIIDLTDSHSAVTGAMLAEIRRQNRILQRKGIAAKSAVICAGARRAGGATENPRVYLSPISTATLAARAHENAFPGAFPFPGMPGDGIPGDGIPGDGIPGDGIPGDGIPGDGSGERERGDARELNHERWGEGTEWNKTGI